MDFRRPLTTVTPTLDGDVLTVLARADVELSGRELARRASHGSVEGVRRAADRLASEGLVAKRAAGGAHLYRLNRKHIAAPWVEGLASLPEQLVARLRTIIDGWEEPAALAFLFGSGARGEASPDSDVDILVIRPSGGDVDSPVWRAQLVELQQAASALTGNDARVLEVGGEDLGGERIASLLADVLREGTPLRGTRAELQRAVERRERT